MLDRTKRNGKSRDIPGRSATQGEQQEPDEQELILCITPAGEWGRTISPIRAVKGWLKEDDMTALREEAGFHHMTAFGQRFALVRVEIFQHQTDNNAFLVEIDIADRLENVLVQSFPSLLRLLRDMAPIVEMGRSEDE